MAIRLSGWKRKNLSQAGRVVLIKVATLSIPGYAMQIFHLSKGMLDRMDRTIKNFFWGHKEDKTHNLPLKAWKDICTPKSNGGLGIWKMLDMNLALISKLTWSIIRNEPKVWVQLIKAKYLRGRRILDVERTSITLSWIGGALS